ncbi:MAG: trypsin-like serine protease [Leptolyngbyaceae cyanobacterium CRU_2_3]|nr:trypsin-like serine protease [Leptolyngbyaceae cyanobacterium CRU_2_3]
MGTAAGLNLLNAASPIDLLSIDHFGQRDSRTAFAQAVPQDAEDSINVRVYQAASPAVVSIIAGNGTGSGSIITPDGLILTNAHVVAGSETVKVTLADRRTFDADVVAFGEAGLDLAAVKIRGQNNLPTLRLAASGAAQVGQRAFAIGNPFGQFQGTFTTGIISRIDPDRGLLQTDAAINPGNSGGPLLNSQGELVGVNSAIFSPGAESGNIGIGFAISIDRVQPFLVAVREGRAPRVAQQSPMLGGGKEAQRIALDSAVEGKLDQTSGVLPSDSSYFDAYTFDGKAGQTVVIEMTSSDLDSYLIVLSSDGTDIAQDDDGGGGRNSKVEVALPADGTYTILANSRGTGEIGSYNLRVAAAGSSPQQQGRALLREQGTLGPGSPVLQSDGSFYREYTFRGNAGQSITASLESTDFDTYLVILDASGQPLGQNDDVSPNSSNSSLTVTLPATGTYRVIANAYERNGQGRYTLIVR